MKRNVEVHTFLSDLWQHLNGSLPHVAVVPRQVENRAKELYPDDVNKPKRKRFFHEGVFISEYITPSVHSFLVSRLGLDSETATKAIVSENKLDRTRGLANATIRTGYPFKHPFGKSIGATAKEIVRKWFESDKPLTSKHPDLCLLEPHRILFEAKYLRSAKTNARVQLVECVYEALFYRGLAAVNEGQNPWVYNYAVALVYDGTDDGLFVRAWNDLNSEVRDALWNAANIFVMPLRGDDSVATV